MPGPRRGYVQHRVAIRRALWVRLAVAAAVVLGPLSLGTGPAAASAVTGEAQFRVASSGYQLLMPGQTLRLRATCPGVSGGGQYAVGGGFVSDYSNADGVRVLSNGPAGMSTVNNADGVRKATAWEVLLTNVGAHQDQVVTYAICANADAATPAPQWQIASSGSEVLAPAGTATLKATCPGTKNGGQYAVGGGFVADYANAAGVRALSNGPANVSTVNNADGASKATAWQATLTNLGTHQVQVAGYAICANPAPGMAAPQFQVVSSGAQILAPDATATLKATCPGVPGGGQYALSGGFVADYANAVGVRALSNGPSNVSLNNNRDGVPKATAWQATLRDVGVHQVQASAYAVCAGIESGGSGISSLRIEASPAPAVAGEPVRLGITTLDVDGHPVAFDGGTLTFSLGRSDPEATIGGQQLGSADSVTLVVPASATGAITVPATFTVAQPGQSVSVVTGSLTAQSGSFNVDAGSPTAVRIDAVTDTSQSPPLPTPAANQPFSVAFTLVDRFGNVAADPAVRVTLSATNPVAGASLQSGPVSSVAGHGTIAATYSTAQTGLELQASSEDLSPGLTTIDVVTAGASSDGSAGTISAGGATAVLPAGSVGPAYLTTQPCDTADPTCAAGVEVTLAGTFTTAGGSELYSDAAPATLTWTCSHADCPTRHFNHSGIYTDLDRIHDFYRYPVEVSLRVNGVYEPFAVAPSCVDLWNPHQWGDTGVIRSDAAVRTGFCVDVYALSRTEVGGRHRYQSDTGALTLPVLFVEDPRMRPF